MAAAVWTGCCRNSATSPRVWSALFGAGCLMVLPNISYSLDLPSRCLDLLSTLLPIIEQNEELSARYGGPPTTTLTLAMAGPLLILPIERIERQLIRN